MDKFNNRKRRKDGKRAKEQKQRSKEKNDIEQEERYLVAKLLMLSLIFEDVKSSNNGRDCPV